MVFQLRIPLVTIFSFNFAIITKNLFALTFVPFFFQLCLLLAVTRRNNIFTPSTAYDFESVE